MISIIVASYNSQNTISDTFKSILSQNYTDYEVIVVDGASADNTLSIIKDFEPKFRGRLHWSSEPDKGIYDAMNKGLMMASGDIVGFLNSDDFYTLDDILYSIAEAFDNYDTIDAVYGDVHYVSREDLSTPVRYYSSENFRPDKIRAGYMPAHPSFYAKRSLYSKYGMFDVSYKVAGDFDILSRFIYIHKIRTAYIKKDFVTMREGGASSSGLKSHIGIIHDHFVSMKKNGIRVDYVRYFLRYFHKMKEFRVR